MIDRGGDDGEGVHRPEETPAERRRVGLDGMQREEAPIGYVEDHRSRFDCGSRRRAIAPLRGVAVAVGVGVAEADSAARSVEPQTRVDVSPIRSFFSTAGLRGGCRGGWVNDGGGVGGSE